MNTAAQSLILDYHQRTKHRFTAYARGPETLDWDAQPAPFRRFEGAPVTPLPRLTAAQGDLRLALERRWTASPPPTPAAALPFSAASLGALLQLSLGLAAWKVLGPDRWAVRANPSSGNLHPTEAYVLMAGQDGFADGLYHYRPDDHALEWRARHRADGARGLGVVLTSVMWREAWKYGERAFRYCQLDTGHALACIAQAAAVLGWQVTEPLPMDAVTLAALAGTDREADFPARRQPVTAREEAEVLLAINTAPTEREAVAATLFSAAALARRSEAAQWQGVASPIDPHPMYRWPVIEEVAAATRSAPSALSAVDSETDVAAVASRQPAPLAPDVFAARAQAPALSQLILGRRSAQRFSPEHIMPLADFQAVLASACRAAPDAMALVLFVHRVEGLTPGLYFLPPRSVADFPLSGKFSPQPVGQLKALPALATSDAEAQAARAQTARLLLLDSFPATEWQRISRSLHCHQDIAASACFALGMIQPLAAALATSPAAYRRLYRECGAVGQALYLAAEAVQLRGTGIGCFFDDPVHELLGLHSGEWQTLYHFTVGLALVDTRLETLPAYAAGDPSSVTENPS